MATTTNFGWETPDDTDLVKDGAAAMRTLGNSIDTSFVDLKGGTSGQILAKASNTDLDYTWIANDQGDITAVTAGTGITVTNGTGPIPSVAIDSTVATLTGTQTLTNKTLTSPALTTPTISTATTNGDLLYGTGSGALTRLGIGSTSQVLTVTGGVPTWAAPAGGGGPTFDAYSTPSQNISASTLTKVTLQNETWDTAGNFASSRFTPTTAGYYQFNAQISFEGSASSTYRLYYYKNGSSYSAYSVGVSVANPTVAYSWTIPLNGSGDYVELYGWTDAGVGPGGARAFYYAQMQGTWIKSL
jgi:hypothetical protein